MSDRDDRTLPLQVLDALHEGVVVVDARRAVVLMNPRAEELLGRRWGPGAVLAELFPEGGALDAIEAAIAAGQATSQAFCHKLGETVLEVGVSPFTGGGTGLGAVILLSDITEAWKAEQDAPAIRLDGRPRAEEPDVGHPQLPQRHPHGHVRRRSREGPRDARAVQDPRRGDARPRARPPVHQPARDGAGAQGHRGPRPVRRARASRSPSSRCRPSGGASRSGCAPTPRAPWCAPNGGPRPGVHEPAVERDQVQPGPRQDRRGDLGRGATAGP